MTGPVRPSLRNPDGGVAWGRGWRRGIDGHPARRYCDAVIVGAYRDFMTTIAASAASLTGLLFVALSVTRRANALESPAVVQQIRAAAALLAFFNALAVSLFGLVPGTNVGYPALVLGISGLSFTAAALRSILSSRVTVGLLRRQAGLIIVLLLIFGTELVNGITLLVSPGSTNPVEIISYALVASVLVGIARAWELVGDRDTGIFASIAVLAEHQHQHQHQPGQSAAGGSGAPGGGDTPGDRTDAPGSDANDPHYPDAQDPGGRPG
jgi:hypothetical protein